MLHLVQSFANHEDPLTLKVGTIELPCPAVVEDDFGLRALLLHAADQTMTSRAWAQAHAAGVSYLLARDEQGWLTAPVEAFMDHRSGDEAHSPTVAFDVPIWEFTIGDEPPTYADIIKAVMAQEAKDAGPRAEITGFVHLHTHTEYSSMDGLSTVDEMITAIGDQQAGATTDHGNVAVHPEFAKKMKAAGKHAIFGMEGYLVEDRFRRPREWWVMTGTDGVEYEIEEPVEDWSAKDRTAARRTDASEVRTDYQHITLWAMTTKGLRNLWAMSTEGHRDGFYYNPRIDYDTLRRLGEGVIASTGCLRGPLAAPLRDGDEAAARHNVTRLMDIFDDRLYVEIQTNQLEAQIAVNRRSLEIAREYSLPPIAVCDSHYAWAEDKEVHRTWLAVATNKSLEDETSLFAGGHDYHLMNETEVREALSYLDPADVDECVANTAALANRCTAELVALDETPVFSKTSREHPDPIEHDVERVIQICMDNWDRKVVPAIARGYYTEEQAMERLEHELDLLVSKAFCGYFLLVAEYVNWAKDRGCLVGPGRGSGGASLVAWLMGITELDPLRLDLLFARFINKGRVGLPDFDVDFPSSWREPLKGHIVDRWGEEYTLTIGTTMRLQIKAAYDSSVRVMKTETDNLPTWEEGLRLKRAVEESAGAVAGTAVTWERFEIDHEDLVADLRERYPEVMGVMERFVGRVRTYGKHPSGMVVSTRAPLTDLPMRVGEDGGFISQFDMNALEDLNYVKFDLLTLRTLDTLQVAMDGIKARHGRSINFYDWQDEYEDPQVWTEISAGNTLGIFQIETSAGTSLTLNYEPSSVDDLAAIMTLVRPGPKRSGLTGTYLRRMHGQETVSYPDPRLEEVLADTYGVPIYQEQVMAIPMLLAGYDEVQADSVRKILGKKKVELVDSAGRDFIDAAVTHGMAKGDAEALWAQLAEFAKYGFGKAHAAGYAVLGYWAAWLKNHYPSIFLSACLSTVKDERIPEFVVEARRLGYAIGAPDVNESGVFFTPTDTMVRYGLASVKGVGAPTAEHIIEHRPYASLEEFREKAMTGTTPVNAGHLSALVSIGAFDSIIENRRATDLELAADASGEAARCVFKRDEAVGPNGLPCVFDWDNEVDPPMVSRGRGKAKTFHPKDPPKRCTVACRNYTPPEPVDHAEVEPYSDADLRDREREMLGVWLSSTPFDSLDPDDLALFHTSEDIRSGPEGYEYVTVGVVDGVRQRSKEGGDAYAFVTLSTQTGAIDAVVFSRVYAESKPYLRKDDLVYLVLSKTPRGLQVVEVVPSQE